MHSFFFGSNGRSLLSDNEVLRSYKLFSQWRKSRGGSRTAPTAPTENGPHPPFDHSSHLIWTGHLDKA